MPTVMTRLARCVVRPRKPTAITAVSVAEQRGQDDCDDMAGTSGMCCWSSNVKRPPSDREDALSEVDDPGRAIDEDERHPDDAEEGSGRDADDDQLQKSRHVRRLDPSPR